MPCPLKQINELQLAEAQRDQTWHNRFPKLVIGLSFWQLLTNKLLTESVMNDFVLKSITDSVLHSTDADATERLGKSDPALEILWIGGFKQLSLQQSPMN